MNHILETAKQKIAKKYLQQDIDAFNAKKNKPILYVKNLTKKYFGKSSPAINQISFEVYPGEFHAFIGANGAGKTTTIKCLIGGYANWSGTILIDGIKNNKEEAKKKIGYIPENARFPEKFSALKYLKWMVQLSGFSAIQAKEFAINKLKELRMWNLRNKSPNSFSSGQKKKILLAQALMHDPDILIMDEPVANLDPKARLEFFETLKKLRSEGKAIFISSHVLAELDLYTTSVTVLDGGKVVYSGDKNAIVELYDKNQFFCETNDMPKTLKIVRSMKIKYRRVPESLSYLLKFSNKKQINEFQKAIFRQKLYLIQFKLREQTLDEVYEKLVVKGSVDTMDNK